MPKPKLDMDAMSAMMAQAEQLPNMEDFNRMADYGKVAYDAQRQFRQKHPVADALLGFVPFVGTAASIDDTAQALMAHQYGDAAINALGIIPGGKAFTKSLEGVSKLDSLARSAMIARGMGHSVDLATLGVHTGAAATAAGVGAAYGAHLSDAVDAADKLP